MNDVRNPDAPGAITGKDPHLDSREVDERIEVLLSDPTEGDEPEAEELKALLALREDVENYSVEWRYGITLIREDYFTDYVKEYATDLGLVSKDLDWEAAAKALKVDYLGWPLCHIDWEAAAKALKVDYTVTYLGDTKYWYRP